MYYLPTGLLQSEQHVTHYQQNLRGTVLDLVCQVGKVWCQVDVAAGLGYWKPENLLPL